MSRITIQYPGGKKFGELLYVLLFVIWPKPAFCALFIEQMALSPKSKTTSFACGEWDQFQIITQLSL